MIFLFLLSVNIVVGQDTDFRNLIIGLTAIMPDKVPSYFLTKSILVIDIATNNQFQKTVVIISDKKDGRTVLGVKMNENLIYVAGYVPVTKNDIFTGEGEFYLYKKEDAQITLVKHLFKTLRKDTGTNKLKEYLEEPEWKVGQTPDYVIAISDKFEVQFMAFMGYMFFLPSNYFDYK